MGITFLGVAVLLLVSGNRTQAFHSGGVAECGGCHSMHSPKAGGSFLLIGIDQSSTCLTCHERSGSSPSSYRISTPPGNMPVGSAPVQRTPGGDFGWLKKDYTWSITRGTSTSTYSEDGDTHGHNIIAGDFGYAVDGTNITAPGGTFPASALGCQACHDPHGQLRRLSDGTYERGGNIGENWAPIIGSGSYAGGTDPASGEAVGAYRLLRGDNDSSIQGVTFAGVPIAIVPDTYNQRENLNQVRVAYGASGANTWGNWCASCHPDNHSTGGNYVHPVDEPLGTGGIAAIYNAYVMTGNLSGSEASSFTSLVPFAEGTDDIGVLKSHAKNDDSYLNGPQNTDQVTCLSCHRAHASGWEYALRWNLGSDFTTYHSLYPGSENGTPPQYHMGRTSAETQAAYYDRPVEKFATYQRVLCNKCHAKD